MTLAVTVLGSSGTYAGPGNACSGYLVRGGGATVVIDTGPGALANLQRHTAVTDVDAVVVTHAHPDHWGELPVWRNAFRYVHDHRDVELYSTAEVLGLGEDVTHGRLAPTFRPQAVADGSEFTVGLLRFRCSRTQHPVETLAVRVDLHDVSFGYSSDTGPGWSPAELGGPLDLLVAEATFLHDERPDEPVHCSALQAGELARGAGARRLAVTHVLPTGSQPAAVAEASEAYGAPVEAARVHRTFRL